MILRVFRVRGPKGHDEAVLAFVRDSLARPSEGRRGPVTVQVARRLIGGSVEAVVVSTWRNWEDIQAYTGPDVGSPMDPNLPEMFEIRVEHYETVSLDLPPDAAGDPGGA
jgi:hypothetical protein